LVETGAHLAHSGPLVGTDDNPKGHPVGPKTWHPITTTNLL
jgi:hypothetical protein